MGFNHCTKIMDLTKKINDLSYGYRKKVGIVQGLLPEPKLVILDESTGGLDPLMLQRRNLYA
jgi:ABC-2 type transport system ATP-binding protein